MRVVAGQAKGRRLIAPTGDATRPTSDRVREAICNMVASRLDFAGAAVADLFAGSGALGIEALSRGAESVVFVESNRQAVAALETNLAAVGLPGALVVRADVLAYLERAHGEQRDRFDLVFVDPPYAFDDWSRLFGRIEAELVVAESDREVAVGARWRVLKVSRYGGTVVTLATPTPISSKGPQ